MKGGIPMNIDDLNVLTVPDKNLLRNIKGVMRIMGDVKSYPVYRVGVCIYCIIDKIFSADSFIHYFTSFTNNTLKVPRKLQLFS